MLTEQPEHRPTIILKSCFASVAKGVVLSPAEDSGAVGHNNHLYIRPWPVVAH